MNYNNVNLWFAKDDEDKYVRITEVNKEDGNIYHCPLCGSDLIPRQGGVNSWHFAHKDKDQCDGESIVHFWVKNKLIEKGTKFTIETDKFQEYVCKEIYIEQSYKIGGGIYKPDITVLTESGETIYFEMAYSNKKKLEDYLDIWIELGNIVVEIDTKKLIESEDKSCLVFKALYYNGKCFNIRKSDGYYNTIGQYKERIIESQEYIKRKANIEKLDWLWREIRLYKKQQNEDKLNDIIQMIDSIENKGEKEIIYNIIVKNKCAIVKDEYENYKFKCYKNYLKNNLELDMESFNLHISSFSKGLNRYLGVIVPIKPFRSNILKSVFNYFVWSENQLYDFDNQDIEILKQYLEYKKRKIKEENISKENWEKVKIIIQNMCNNKQGSHGKLEAVFLKDKLQCEIFYEDVNFDKECILVIDDKKIKTKTKEIMFGMETIKYKILDKNINLTFPDILNTALNCGLSYISCSKEKWQESKIKKDLLYRDIKNILSLNNIDTLEDKDILFRHNDKNILMYSDINNDFCNKENIRSDKDSNYDQILSLQYIYDNDYYLINNYDNWSICKYDLEYYLKNIIDDIPLKVWSEKTINCSFNNLEGYSSLPRYDFVEFDKKLIQLLYFIKTSKETLAENIAKGCNKSQIIEIKTYEKELCLIKERVNNQLNKIIYPIVCMFNDDTAHIRLNCSFTKDESGKFRPWLIKDFVDHLNRLGINAYNIK